MKVKVNTVKALKLSKFQKKLRKSWEIKTWEYKHIIQWCADIIVFDLLNLC